MLVEFIRARVRDGEALAASSDRWKREVKQRAEGFLGSTGGLTPSGDLVMLARFESAEAAAANGGPELDAVWEEFCAALDGEPAVKRTEAVDVQLERGCDRAGFVQVMTGAGDEAALRDLDRRFTEEALHLRPDLLGAYRAYFDDGTFADVAYFTNEADARAAEAQEMPESVQALFAELGQVVGDMEYHDLRDPWIT